jgi:hypothetical protein
MNALHIILYHLAKLHVPCHEQSYRANSCLLDGHLVCANHCISECRLCLLFLHVYHSDDTLEYSDCAMSSTPSNYKFVHDNRFHGDLVFDPRSDLSQGGGDDAEHPTDITMSRVHSASDTCDIYFTYIKVNHLLYTCSLDPFEDGILLDTFPVFMHRYCRSFTDGEEECKRQGSPTPCAREAWKRRKKKRRQASGKPGTSGLWPELSAPGPSGLPGTSGPRSPDQPRARQLSV